MTLRRSSLRFLFLLGALVALLFLPSVVAAAPPWQTTDVIHAGPGPAAMDGQAIMTVAAAVVALTQLAKWASLPDRWGPVIVLMFSALGVGMWAYQQGGVARAETFAYFAGWIAVATSAAGVFGFTRAAVSAVTAAKPPPAGAGANPTTP